MRVVLDTNIWVSALLLPNSQAGKVINFWKQNKFTAIISQPILNELKEVLMYPKIQKRLHWDNDKIEQYILLLTFFAEFIELKKGTKVKVERDEDDTLILDKLITSKAEYLVTGDKDLLCLNGQFPIITLSYFYDILSS